MHFGLGCLDFTNEYVIDIVLTCRIEKDGAGSPSFRVLLDCKSVGFAAQFNAMLNVYSLIKKNLESKTV